MSIKFVAALASAAVAEDVCRALALSGGAVNGAWEAGLLYGLTHYGNEEDYAYDVVTGVSAGSWNSAMISGWPIGSEYEMSEWLTGVWANLTTETIHTKREGGWHERLFEEPSLSDNSAILEWLNEQVNYKSEYQRKMVLGAMLFDTGDYYNFTELNTKRGLDLAMAAKASGSFPPVWPPTIIDDQLYVDGATGWNVLLDAAIDRCLEIVDDPSKIILDVAICIYDPKDRSFEVSSNAGQNYLNAFRLKRSYHGFNAIQEQKRAFPTVQYRHYFTEPENPYEHTPFNFDPEQTAPLIELGKQQAKAAVEAL